MKDIRSASDFIDRTIGKFIPRTETRKLDGPGGMDLKLLEPLLSDDTEATVIDDGTTLAAADLLFYPAARYWENGPFSRISIDPDATGISSWTRERDIISVAGRWGKYEETISTGETITQADASTTVLTAANGANLSPGMVLLIESEQELIESTSTSVTDTTTDLDGAIDNVVDVVTLSDGTKVNVGEIIQIDVEDMKVLRINTNTVYVERSYNGTAAAAHLDEATVNVYRTYVAKRGVNGTTAAAHSAKAASRYIPPFDVNELCRQIAGLTIKKASTSWAGRTANAETGEVFYINEYPKALIKEIKQNYRIIGL